MFTFIPYRLSAFFPLLWIIYTKSVDSWDLGFIKLDLCKIHSSNVALWTIDFPVSICLTLCSEYSLKNNIGICFKYKHSKFYGVTFFNTQISLLEIIQILFSAMFLLYFSYCLKSRLSHSIVLLFSLPLGWIPLLCVLIILCLLLKSEILNLNRVKRPDEVYYTFKYIFTTSLKMAQGYHPSGSHKIFQISFLK